MMKLKQIAGLLVLLVALAGCAGVIVLPIDEGLSHDQIVNRLKKLIKEKSVLTYRSFREDPIFRVYLIK